MSERRHDACDGTREGCPFQETIGSLNKTVFIGNGSPALTVQIGNLSTKIDTTHKLIVLAMLVIPVLLMLFQWGATAIGMTHLSKPNAQHEAAWTRK